LILLIPPPDTTTPARQTATSDSVTIVVVPPTITLGSLDGSNGFLRGNFTLSNHNNFAIADAEVVCSVMAASGTVLDRYRFTISEIIPANSSKTMNRYQFGAWPQQAKSLRCDGNKAVKR
jgi:hypothetical protein